MKNNFLDLVREFESLFGSELFANYNLNGDHSNGGRSLKVTDNFPNVNVFEDEWVIKFDVITPGLSKDDIKIEINGDRLTFTGEKKSVSVEKGEYVSKEYYYNKFHRSFDIPNNVVSDEIYAKVENGITTIFLPKEKPTKTKLHKRVVKVE
jgi:HSP20 family protein